MLASIDEQAKLDAALDAALDDLADSDDEDQQHACSTPQISDSGCAQECHSTPRFIGPPRPPDSYSTSSSSPLEGWSPDKLFESMMQQMLEGADHRGSTDEDPFIGQLMKDVQNQLQEDLQSSNNSPNNSSKSQKPASKAKASLTTGKECSTRQRSNTSAESPNSDKVELEAAISDLVKGFSKQASVAESGVANHETLPNGSGAEENFLLSLMHSLSSAGLVDNNNNNQSDGADFNPDKVIDGMMEHLLSKELMYDPMKQVASKFPLWLKDRQSTLSVEEYEL